MTRSWYVRRGKRVVDVALAGSALVVCAPLLVAIAATIRTTMGSPVLFRQQRPGYLEKPFTLLKFRTMTEANREDGMPLPDAQRLTRVGRFLRRTSLDELPELFNVLRGEMSLVGPRPLLMKYLGRYDAHQRRRHDVRPGVTGLAQVRGRNSSSWQERFEHDVHYVQHCSPWLDLRILVATVGVALRGVGVNEPGHATRHEFEGSPPLEPRSETGR